MNLNEAKTILKNAGYLLEFRDSSNPLDRETEESNWKSDRTSWNNVKVNYKTNIKGEDTTKKANAVAKMTNELISKVDEVCNKFEDYDYFVKRYDSNKIQIRTTEQADTGVPFIQISVNEKDGEYTFCCGLGRVEQELRRKTYKEYNSIEDVLKWVSACLGNGYINESLEEAKQILNDNGYIVEDTDDWDEADMPIGTPKQRADRVNKHEYFRDLDHKYTDAANFNIKNLFYGVEKELKKVYKKVEIEASDYDDVESNQFVRYYFKYNKSSYVLEVMYYDEKGVIVMQIIDEDAIGANSDTFDITTIDDAIEQIVEFTNDNV